MTKKFNSKINIVFGHAEPIVGAVPVKTSGHSPVIDFGSLHRLLSIPANDTLTIPAEVRSPSTPTAEPKEPPASFDDAPQLNYYRPTRNKRPI